MPRIIFHGKCEGVLYIFIVGVAINFVSIKPQNCVLGEIIKKTGRIIAVDD